MVEYTAYVLHGQAAFLRCRVIQYVAFGQRGVVGVLLAEYALKT